MNAERTYTEDQLQIELLKKESSTTNQTLNRIENRLDKLETKMDGELNSIEKKIDSQFKWILSIMGGVVLTFVAAVLQHWIK